MFLESVTTCHQRHSSCLLDWKPHEVGRAMGIGNHRIHLTENTQAIYRSEWQPLARCLLMCRPCQLTLRKPCPPVPKSMVRRSRCSQDLLQLLHSSRAPLQQPHGKRDESWRSCSNSQRVRGAEVDRSEGRQPRNGLRLIAAHAGPRRPILQLAGQASRLTMLCNKRPRVVG